MKTTAGGLAALLVTGCAADPKILVQQYTPPPVVETVDPEPAPEPMAPVQQQEPELPEDWYEPFLLEKAPTALIKYVLAHGKESWDKKNEWDYRKKDLSATVRKWKGPQEECQPAYGVKIQGLDDNGEWFTFKFDQRYLCDFYLNEGMTSTDRYSFFGMSQKESYKKKEEFGSKSVKELRRVEDAFKVKKWWKKKQKRMKKTKKRKRKR